MSARPLSGERPAQRGFTLLELVVVVCLVGIFAAVALDRFLRYQELAEKTAMEATIGSLKSALTLQVADRITRSGLAAVRGLEKENPIGWLADPPPGYLGIRSAPTLDQVPLGSWYFDNTNNTLVYRPQRTRFLTTGSGDERIPFRTTIRLEEGGTAGAPARGIAELTIRPTVAFRWQPEF